MRAWIGFIAALWAFALHPTGAQTAFAAEPASACGIPTDIHDGWAMTSPEKQGINARLLCTMDDGINDGKLANVDDIIVIRHGVLVYERYYNYPHQLNFDATTRHDGYSMTKSVVSLLVGIAMDRGLIKDMDAPVAAYFPDNADLRMPGKDPITLRHLLMMSAGLGSSTAPGVAFAYDNGETELIGAILNKVTGNAVDVLARENIFEPLGIKDVGWDQDPLSGVATSAYGLSLRPGTGRKSASSFSTVAFGKAARLFQGPGWISRRPSTSRPKSRSLMAISGGLAARWTGSAKFDGSPPEASILKRSSSSPRSIWWSSSTRPGDPRTWLGPSWSCWIDTSYPQLSGIDVARTRTRY